MDNVTTKKDRKEYSKNWYQQNKERKTQQARKRKANRTEEQIAIDKEKQKKRNEEYRAKNLDQIRVKGAESARKARAKNPIKYRIRDIVRTYNVTQEQAEELYERRNTETCESCGQFYYDSKGNKKPLNIDHNHKTGKVRGLLCKPCNTGYGQFEENFENIDRGSSWVENDGIKWE